MRPSRGFSGGGAALKSAVFLLLVMLNSILRAFPHGCVFISTLFRGLCCINGRFFRRLIVVVLGLASQWNPYRLLRQLLQNRVINSKLFFMVVGAGVSIRHLQRDLRALAGIGELTEKFATAADYGLALTVTRVCLYQGRVQLRTLRRFAQLLLKQCH